MFTRLPSKKLIFFISTLILFLIIIASNYPSKSPPFYTTNVTTSSYSNTSFKQQLINDRLSSYYRTYNDSYSVCNMTSALTKAQQPDFHIIPQLLQTLQQQIVPYPNEYFYGRGIVLTVGQHQFKLAQVNLKMIELTATKLSVQIWYSSSQIPHKDMNALLRIAPNLNVSACCFLTAECRTLTHVWQLNPIHVYKPNTGYLPKSFPYKPAAIVSATFEEVLFLDCDAYLTRDPEELFLSDPMYLKFGALFFPDAIISRQHPAVWKLFNTSCAQDEYEFDSATILVDKRRVWNGLYMTKRMNDHHKIFYQHVTDGDKDTFRLAFRYTKIKYYLVMTPCASGPFNGSHFCGLTLCKTDSLSQHIYINHVHLFKYENVRYSAMNLGYTRIGLGDPNNNQFLFQHCRLPKAPTSCFHILKRPNQQMMPNNCYNGEITVEEIEDHEYRLNEPLLSEKSKNNAVLMSKTNDVMLDFVDNFLRIRQLMFNDQF